MSPSTRGLAYELKNCSIEALNYYLIKSLYSNDTLIKNYLNATIYTILIYLLYFNQSNKL